MSIHLSSDVYPLWLPFQSFNQSFSDLIIWPLNRVHFVMYLVKQIIEKRDIYICSNPDSAFVFVLFFPTFGLVFFLDLLHTPTSSNYLRDAQWIPSIISLCLIMEVNWFLPSTKTRSHSILETKTRTFFRKNNQWDYFHIVVVNSIVYHICTVKCTKYHHVVG